MLVVVTGAGVTVAVETLVVVCSGMEMKELQNLVAEALMAGLWRMLRTSETAEQVDRLRAARSSALFPRGLEETRGVIDAKRAERKTKEGILAAISILVNNYSVIEFEKGRNGVREMGVVIQGGGSRWVVKRFSII